MQFESSQGKDPSNEVFIELLGISRLLATSIDLDQTLRLIIEKAACLMQTERATVFLYDIESGELFIRSALEKLEVRFSIDRGIAGACARTGKTVLTNDAYQHPDFNQDIDLMTGFRSRNIIATPLLDYNKDLVGVLQVVNKERGDFDEKDIFIIEILAAQAGVALQRAKLIAIEIEKNRIQKELEIAGSIQREFLQGSTISIPNYGIQICFHPADEAGGDCYDFFPLRDGRWVIMMADATGHGIGPCLISIETRALIRGIASSLNDLALTASHVNELLAKDLPPHKFITVFLGFLNPSNHEMCFISAGQQPLLFFQHDSGQVIHLKASNPPMGLFSDLDLENTSSIKFDAGDTLWLFTDGFHEYRNSAGEFFGIPKVEDCLRNTGHKPLKTAMKEVLSEIRRFAEDANQEDDLTFIMLRRKR